MSDRALLPPGNGTLCIDEASSLFLLYRVSLKGRRPAPSIFGPSGRFISDLLSRNHYPVGSEAEATAERDPVAVQRTGISNYSQGGKLAK